MRNSKNVEKTLYKMYFDRFGKKMDEMKMHKLMYFTQREALMDTGNLLFSESFYGWKFGPVLMSVRTEYKNDCPYANVEEYSDEFTKELLNRVLDRYGNRSSWSLSRLSHDEVSWKHSRQGLKPEENGNVVLLEKLMKCDALKEKKDREYMARRENGRS